jgi:hypothetical protein
MSQKIKPSRQRPREKLIEGARDNILDAYEEAAEPLTNRETLDLIATLREDLDLRQSEIEYAAEAQRRKRQDAKAKRQEGAGRVNKAATTRTK